MIGLSSSGSFKSFEKYVAKVQRKEFVTRLNAYGQQGVTALANATPVNEGLTKAGWKFRIVKTRTGYAIEWYNTNTLTGVPVAVLIQYGHATKNGGYVEGLDYINPAIRPVFAKIVSDLRKEVS